MTRRPPLLLISLLALGCGHRGNPLPPLRRTPPPPADFRLAQRGDAIELSATAPAASVDRVAYQTVTIEFLYGAGEIDLERAGSRLLARATPGTPARRTLPLPAEGTLFRAAARAVSGGEKSARTLTQVLVVQRPLEAPRELTATLTAEGIALNWQGEVPKPVPPAPTPKPAAFAPASRAPSVGASAAAAASGPVGPAPAPSASPAPSPAAASQGVLPNLSPAPSPTPASTAGTTAPVPKARGNGFLVYRRAVSDDFALPLTREPLEARSHADAAPLGTKVCYVVRAAGSTDPLIESAPSNEACAERRDITPPAPPVGLAVLPRGSGLELLWSPSSEEDLGGYRVFRQDEGGAPQRLAELPATRTSFLDEGAVQGRRYLYSLTAYDSSGNESKPTEPVEARRP